MQTPFGYELTNLSNTHDAIANWLIANPGKGQMGRCAQTFGITGAWLSTLVHQDAFRAMMKSKQGKVFEEVVIPLQSKILGVAHKSVERLGEILETTEDDRLVRDIGKDMLGSLGFSANTKAPSVQINQTTNNLTIDAEALADARARQSQHYGRVLENSIKSGDTPALAGECGEAGALTKPESVQAAELSYDSEAEVGETREVRASNVNSKAAVPWRPKAGCEV